MLCFKMENVTASIIYGGVSQFILIEREREGLLACALTHFS